MHYLDESHILLFLVRLAQVLEAEDHGLAIAAAAGEGNLDEVLRQLLG